MSVPIQLVAARLERPYIQLDHNTITWLDETGYTILVNITETLLSFWRFRLSPLNGHQCVQINLDKTPAGTVDEHDTAFMILNLARSYEQIAAVATSIAVVGRNWESTDKAE